MRGVYRPFPISIGRSRLMDAQALTIAQLARLAEKYRWLAELRARREALQAEGQSRFDEREARARRTAFRRLAREFPGALRELEVTSAEVLRARHHDVQQAHRALMQGAADALALWMELALAYHHAVREALAIKRWLAAKLPRGGELDDGLRAEFARWHARRALDDRPIDLALHLRPPGGRLLTAVWLELEQRFGRPRAELEALLFQARG